MMWMQWPATCMCLDLVLLLKSIDLHELKKRVGLEYDIQKFDSNEKEGGQRGGLKKKRGLQMQE